MKSIANAIIACALVLIGANVVWAQPRPDPMAENLIPPQLIMQHADDLGLDAGQKEFLQARMAKAQERFPELQKRLEHEVGAMGEMVSQEHPDEQKTLGQLDKVLDCEREIKHEQIALMLSIRNRLRPEQLAKARELQQKMMADAHNHGPAQQIPEALQAKMHQVSDMVHHWQQDGDRLNAVRPMMEQVSHLIHDGKFKEAEDALDGVLKMSQQSDKQP